MYYGATMKFERERGSTFIAGRVGAGALASTAAAMALLTLIDAPLAHAVSTTKANAGSCTVANDEAIADLFRRWNLALASLDSSRVAALYWPDAVLLPTVSNVPRTDTASIKDYFVHFLQKFPRGQIVKRVTHHGCNASIDAGLYDFSVMDSSGNASVVSARYTFVYTYRDGTWKIQQHHSSAMPEPVDANASVNTRDIAHSDTPRADATPPAMKGATSGAPETASSESVSTGVTRARILLESASRSATSYLTVEQRRKVGRETVGLKVCATNIEAGRSFEISDAAPQSEANEAALAWARAARWRVTGTPSVDDPVCAQVVVRFTDAGT
jgi:uncharacterized protein (TIGR02246 family)